MHRIVAYARRFKGILLAVNGAKALKKPGKTGRPRSKNIMSHTAVVLPPALREELKRLAQAGGRGFSAEVRQRLQTSYELEGLDPHTRQLIEDTRKLADSL